MSAPRALLLLAALCAAPTPFGAFAASRSDTVHTSVTGAELSGILAGMGLVAELSTDPTGDPRLVFEQDGYKVLVATYGCEGGTCSSVQLYAGFSVGRKTPLEKINDWNRGHRFGRAYLDAEGDPVIEYDLDLEGGVSKRAIEEWVRTFGLILPTFAAHVGFR